MAFLNVQIENLCNSRPVSGIREANNYFVDKTEFLAELFRGGVKGKLLFTRPRRLGKSVMLSMVGDFLDISMKDKSPALFRDLKIMDHPDLVSRHMNQYPVIRMSWKDIYGETISEVQEGLADQLISAMLPYRQVIASSQLLTEKEKALFWKIFYGELEHDKLPYGLGYLVRLLYFHYNKDVVVLIDEYDMPLARAYERDPDQKELYPLVRDLVERTLSSVCKPSGMVQAVILTGCMLTVNGSTASGVNNIKPFTVTMPQYSQYFGFTEAEAEKILKDAELLPYASIVRDCYDGYLFAGPIFTVPGRFSTLSMICSTVTTRA